AHLEVAYCEFCICHILIRNIMTRDIPIPWPPTPAPIDGGAALALAVLREHLDMTAVLLHPSKVNRRTDTYDGIDVCGQRLADEIRSVVAAHPSLQRISVIGHSMGGLLLRYAVVLLYDRSTGRIAGLKPAHFISLATPHLGCDAGGLAQSSPGSSTKLKSPSQTSIVSLFSAACLMVPLISWVPVKPVQRMLQVAGGPGAGRFSKSLWWRMAPSWGNLRVGFRSHLRSHVLSIPTASLMFRRTGRQFFLVDGGSSGMRYNSSSSNGRGGTTAAGVSSGPRGLSSGPKGSPAVAPPPLLYCMTQDEPERGLYFYSALASFASRTAYANMDGDHLVGWANSSLRFLHQLPQLPEAAVKAARGVVLQDPLMAAFHVRGRLVTDEPQRATSPTVFIEYRDKGRDRDQRTRHHRQPYKRNRWYDSRWRWRVHYPAAFRFSGCCHHGAFDVTRRWLNFEGMAVAQHLARQLVAMEAEWGDREAVMDAASCLRLTVPEFGMDEFVHPLTLRFHDAQTLLAASFFILQPFIFPSIAFHWANIAYPAICLTNCLVIQALPWRIYERHRHCIQLLFRALVDCSVVRGLPSWSPAVAVRSVGIFVIHLVLTSGAGCLNWASLGWPLLLQYHLPYNLLAAFAFAHELGPHVCTVVRSNARGAALMAALWRTVRSC
ncbi:hypothetical protein VOLCADRAFT_91609, partial [Volvox carteri f. nagariensis]